MTDPAAKGERFMALSGDFLSISDIAKILKHGMGTEGSKVRTREVPDFLVRLASIGDPALRPFLNELGKPRNATNEKATRLLGWAPRSREESILSTAESMLRLGLLKKASKVA
jgi:dihydroflavonol-4-reductase